MLAHLRANLWLLVLSVALCSVAYPAALLAIGQSVFRDQAQGSLLYDKQGQPIGSRLIAQPFSGAQYFQPRPSAVGYNGAGSGGSNWGANNPLLRDRVARALGPIVKHAGGPKRGQLVGPEIEAWFRKDRGPESSGIVAEWASAHPALAASWVKADPRNAAFVAAWQGEHSAEVAQWIQINPGSPEPKPEELAVPFFQSFSKEHPGRFPGVVERTTADGKTESVIAPVEAGTEIQSIFFDLWRQEHPDVALEPVPADMVMASGSGLDPDITLKNALYQLDRVVDAWAGPSHRDPATVRQQIEDILRKHSHAPLGGLAGTELVNVLAVNLALREQFAGP